MAKLYKVKTFRKGVIFPEEMHYFFKMIKISGKFINGFIVDCVEKSPEYKQYLKEKKQQDNGI